MVATVFGEYYYNFGWWGMCALSHGFRRKLLDIKARQVVSVIQTGADCGLCILCVRFGRHDKLVWAGLHVRLRLTAAIFGILYLANVSAKPILYGH